MKWKQWQQRTSVAAVVRVTVWTTYLYMALKQKEQLFFFGVFIWELLRWSHIIRLNWHPISISEQKACRNSSSLLTFPPFFNQDFYNRRNQSLVSVIKENHRIIKATRTPPFALGIRNSNKEKNNVILAFHDLWNFIRQQLAGFDGALSLSILPSLQPFKAHSSTLQQRLSRQHFFFFFYNPQTLPSHLNKWDVARSDTFAHRRLLSRLLCKYTRHPNATIRSTACHVAA